jgi:DNA-binding NarL/FixJ family response regulator
LRNPIRATAGGGTVKPSGKATIVIIDHRVLLRDCLVKCLSAAVPDDVVVAFASVAEWREVERTCPPAAVVIFCSDSRNRDDTSFDRYLPLVSHDGSRVPAIVMSDQEDAEHVRIALESGAQGYIPTSLSLDLAVGAMQFVEAGGTFVPASTLTSRAGQGDAHSGQRGRLGGLLTERQAAVLECLRKGKANKQIAYELSMSEGTVKVHVRTIMKKLKARNRTEVAVLSNPLSRHEKT